jgi:putative ABC transport system permease protein
VTLSVVTAICLSFIPRLGATRASSSLVPGNRSRGLDLSRRRFQQSLVVAQVALSMILLTGAGLLVRTLMTLDSVDTGVRIDHAMTLTLPVQGDILKSIQNRPANLAKYQRMRERVAAMPGVEIASLAAAPPLRSTGTTYTMAAEDRAVPANQEAPHISMKGVDANYFKAAGIPVLRGRGFLASYDSGAAPEAILSASLARRVFGDGDPIGRRVAQTGDLMMQMMPTTTTWRTVVGVVGDTRDRGLEDTPTPTMYTPFTGGGVAWSATLVVRTSADPITLQPGIVRAIRSLYPEQVIDNVATIQQLRDEDVGPRRINALFIASFGVLAFVIAMVGITGVLAFSVSSRTGEIGIRMSLGADGGRVRRMILGEGGALLVIGVVAGLGGALAATRLMRSFLFGVTEHDPITLGVVATALIAAGIAACWIPAAKAAAIDPIEALRAD